MSTIEQERDKENKRIAAIIAGVVGIGVFLAIFLGSWTIPHPLPDEVIVELLEPAGAQEGGGSAAQEQASSAQETPEVQEEPQPEVTQADIVTETQEEESVEVSASDKVEKEEAKEEPKDVSDPTRLYPGSSDSGNEDGDGGGTGNGTGTGSGNNTGPGHGSMGNGDWYLSGRGIVNKPVIHDQIQEEGKVVVDIIVDRTGQVVRATANLSKSTTSSSDLIDRAVKAAYQATFTPKAAATVEQKGFLTFVFRKQ